MTFVRKTFRVRTSISLPVPIINALFSCSCQCQKMESAQARVQSAATAVYEELDKAVLRKIQVCI